MRVKIKSMASQDLRLKNWNFTSLFSGCYMLNYHIIYVWYNSLRLGRSMFYIECKLRLLLTDAVLEWCRQHQKFCHKNIKSKNVSVNDLRYLKTKVLKKINSSCIFKKSPFRFVCLHIHGLFLLFALPVFLYRNVIIHAKHMHFMTKSISRKNANFDKNDQNRFQCIPSIPIFYNRRNKKGWILIVKMS